MEGLDCHLDIQNDEDAQDLYADCERRVEWITAVLTENQS